MKFLMIILLSISTNIDTWDNNMLNGWYSDMINSLNCSNMCLDVKFNYQPIAAFESLTVYKNVTNMYPTSIGFEFKYNNDIPPSAMWLRLRCDTNWWHINLPFNLTSNYTSYSVNSLYGNWQGPYVTNTKEQFMLELRHLNSVGVYLRRHGSTEEQHYNIDNFYIKYIEVTNIIDDIHEPIYDSDFDGQNDYYEYISSTDPYNPNSFFGITSIREWAGLPEICWSSKWDRSYSIYKSTNLLNGFICILSNHPGSGAVYDYFADRTATNGNVFFYKIDLIY